METDLAYLLQISLWGNQKKSPLYYAGEAFPDWITPTAGTF